MGLFSRKKREPVVHPDRVRRIHVSAGRAAVVARLEEYEQLSGHGDPVGVRLAESGGWTTVVLAGRIHPWAFHNLVLWLVDLPGADVVGVADMGEGEVSYWLVDDEEDSWLSGYDDRGRSLSVRVPDNAVVWGDELSHPPATVTQTLVDHDVPTDLHYADGDEASTVRLEDPQHDLNPGNEARFDTRKKMREAGPNFLY